MATFRGKEGLIKIGANVVAEVDNWSVDQASATEEDTAQGDDWQTFKPGLKTSTGSIECHWDDTDATGQELLLVGAEVTLLLYPEGDAVGANELTVSAIITGISMGVPKDNIVSRSFQWQGNGELVIGTA